MTPQTDTPSAPEPTIRTRRVLADAAKMHSWQQVLDTLKEYPDLVNATRPNGTSLYTPLHRAAHGGAPVDVVEQLVALGASVTAQNAKGERPVDVARRRSQLHLVEILEPPTAPVVMPLLRYPSDITEALSTCALRFDGYAYVATVARSGSSEGAIDLSHVVGVVVESLRLHDNLNDNFAAFFGLQRYLHKWGGEHLTKYSAEHIAYDFLFLHLYHQEPDERFRMEQYCREWEQRFAARDEEIAAYVRKSFRRIGSGPEFI